MVMHYGYNSYDWSLFHVHSALQCIVTYLVTLRLLCKNDNMYLLYNHDCKFKILDITQTKIKYSLFKTTLLLKLCIL